MALLNGRLPAAMLSTIKSHLKHYKITRRGTRALAREFDRLDLMFYREFDRHIYITDSYRSLAEQQDVWRRKPGLAAYPGTSNHGWGLALDLGSGINRRSSPEHKWMQKYARRCGFVNPNWATPGAPGFQKDEPWHWEYSKSVQWRRFKIVPTFHRLVRKEWQRQLGVKTDGIFGMGSVMQLQTLINSKNGRGGFQMKEGPLKVDGHAGYRTWCAVQKLMNVWAEKGHLDLNKPLKVTGKRDARTLQALRKSLNLYLWE